MYFLGVIEVFLVLVVWFLGAVNTTLHIIDLILYMICWSLKDINVFFWWGDPRMHVDKDKRWNRVYWKPCTTSRAINPYKVEFPLVFSLRGRYWKNYGGKAVKHWELKLALLVTGEDIFIFNGCMCSCCIAEDLEFWLNPFYKDIPTPWISS